MFAKQDDNERGRTFSSSSIVTSIDKRATSIQEDLDKQKAANKKRAKTFVSVGCVLFLFGIGCFVAVNAVTIIVGCLFVVISIILCFWGRQYWKKAPIQETKDNYVRRRSVAQMVSHKKCEKCKQTGKIIIHFEDNCSQCDGTGTRKKSRAADKDTDVESRSVGCKSCESCDCCKIPKCKTCNKCKKCNGMGKDITDRRIISCYRCGGEGNIPKTNMELLICCCKAMYRCGSIMTFGFGYEEVFDCCINNCMDSCCDSCCESCCGSCCDFDSKIIGIFSGNVEDLVANSILGGDGQDGLLDPRKVVTNARALYRRGYDYRQLGVYYDALTEIKKAGGDMTDQVSGPSSPTVASVSALSVGVDAIKDEVKDKIKEKIEDEIKDQMKEQNGVGDVLGAMMLNAEG